MSGHRELDRVLREIRELSLSEHEKGKRFERLMLGFLRVAPQWATKFRQVWLWEDWTGNAGEVDTGIDLIAEHADGSGFTAIQCKFYTESSSLTLQDTGTFFARSGKPPFTERMLIATTSNWSTHLINAIEDQDKPTLRLTLPDLAESGVDWGAWRADSPGPLRRKTRKPLPHQQTAIEDVIAGFGQHDRGKLIMACGTGKTFTGQLIAERIAGEGGLVLVLLPSISLLSQTVKEWAAWSSLPMTPFAVCSDTKAGTRGDQEDISPFDLVVPATTDAEVLLANLGRAPEGHLRAIFSTYQSTSVIADAQRLGLEPFDLVICDEAHRTTGVTLVGDEDSNFTRVHDNEQIGAAKRLYMTATPRVYSDGTKAKADAESAVLASMDDDGTFGPEFHRVGFREAVDRGLLTDYKVLVLAVDEGSVSTAFQDLISDEDHDLRLEGAAKMVGCLNALTKRNARGKAFSQTDATPMQTALAFNNTIAQSQEFAALFSEVADRFDLAVSDLDVTVEVDHVDGGHNALEREQKLAWLAQDVGEDRIRILSNARCLTEGVDVPALDAVIFLEPRNSMVDVIQAVGRVMRRDPSGRKKLGYVILPIGIPANLKPEEALADNQAYKVVWQVLNALRSHDERLNAVVNQLEVNNERPDMIEVEHGGMGEPQSLDLGDEEEEGGAGAHQLTLGFPIGEVSDAIYAQLVKKVGTRHYWEDWATDIAAIAARHETRIHSLIDDPSLNVGEAFEGFVAGLRANLNDSIDTDDAIGMLSQHLITRPVFEALFEDYDFIGSNPVSRAMQRMIDRLDEHSLDKDRDTLAGFYRDVKLRAEGIDNAEGKQRIITELYERFFAKALPKTADQLGIVYTPIEVVDFIVQATDGALRRHLNCSLTDEDVHILDPFTGTGTFLVRLLQSGLISPHDLARKYATELHANEILLLAYYIAAINIEASYHDLTAGVGADRPYQAFPGIVLTDTFQLSEEGSGSNIDLFGSNNKRADRQRSLPIRVVLGNPPWSVGQTSANDNTQNLKYPRLDERIADTYAARSTATLKNSLYDSYIRAIRWASDRILENGAGGIVAYVSNGGYIDSNVADGLRLSLGGEFHHLYVYNLRGNQRTAGERSRREGGKIFGQGSRATVAILLAVRGSGDVPPAGAKLHYRDIGDYLTRSQKLSQLRSDAAAESTLEAVPWRTVKPNEHGDWINQRSDRFFDYPPLCEPGDDQSIFAMRTSGLVTSRDAWNYNSSQAKLRANVRRMVEFFNDELRRFRAAHPQLGGKAPAKRQAAKEFVSYDERSFSWDHSDFVRIVSGEAHSVDESAFHVATYRPFERRFVLAQPALNNRTYQLPRLFPSSDSRTPTITLTEAGSRVPFSVLIVDRIPDSKIYIDAIRCFPLRTFEGDASAFDPGLFDDQQPTGWQPNVSDAAIGRYRRLDPSITDEDVFFHVYGILHSPRYRKAFAADLKKALPRIPPVESAETFWAFATAGRALADLHLRYEEVEAWPDLETTFAEDFDARNPKHWRVEKMRYPKVTDPMSKKKVDDKTRVVVNRRIAVGGIPERAHEYQLGSRSAVDWILNQYQVKTHKKSGITNDPNDWAIEHDQPSYIYDLLCSVVTVSMRTLEIIDELPLLDL
ncbi:MAG: damage-inducible protein [Acidobacteria bacterium]|nr:MAG: damage-inducible protein [Acidobacteriota bacterium]